MSGCRNSIAGIPKKMFRAMLDLAASNSYFLFNRKLYRHVDGVGMGLPLGPTFANIFLCFHEKKWLSACPSEFRPAYYKRYVDDCFLIFNDISHMDNFLDFLNGQHPKIKFTKEVESDRSLPFLDVCGIGCLAERCFGSSRLVSGGTVWPRAYDDVASCDVCEGPPGRVTAARAVNSRVGHGWYPLGRVGHGWYPLGRVGHRWYPLGRVGHRSGLLGRSSCKGTLV